MCKDCENARSSAGRLQRLYGITPDDYVTLFRAQEGACAICHKPETVEGRSLAVDHDHETGEVRGLLCFRCNTALGKFNDDPQLLRAAAAYLERT